jgi:hypothetical protein
VHFGQVCRSASPSILERSNWGGYSAQFTHRRRTRTSAPKWHRHPSRLGDRTELYDIPASYPGGRVRRSAPARWQCSRGERCEVTRGNSDRRQCPNRSQCSGTSRRPGWRNCGGCASEIDSALAGEGPGAARRLMAARSRVRIDGRLIRVRLATAGVLGTFVYCAASLAAMCGATRKALAAIVRLGLIAPLRGMNEASTT